jgi:hypothetical protein
MKKLSNLLAQRPALLAQARLANLAFAHETLAGFARRIARAPIAGRVVLRQIDPGADRYWPTLTALDGSQSVLDEHFDDEDLLNLADVIAFTTGSNAAEFTFDLDDIAEFFLAQLRGELARAGVVVDDGVSREIPR